MHSRGSMFLDAEPPAVGQLLPRRALRLGMRYWVAAGLRGLLEVTLAAVLFKGGQRQLHRPSRGRRCRRERTASFTPLTPVHRTSQNDRSTAARWEDRGTWSE